MLGIVRIAADPLPRSAGCPPPPRRRAMLQALVLMAGAHADLEAAVLLLAQGQADLDTLDGQGRLVRSSSSAPATPAA